MVSSDVQPSRLRPLDVLRVGFAGLQSRKLRAALSALGIAIGIASLVGVLGLSESSKSDLLDKINALGTNLLQVTPSAGFGAGDATLPDEAVAMIGRVGSVEEISFVSSVDAGVYRSDFIPSGRTGGISVVGSDMALLDTLNGEIAHGTFLPEAALEYPAVVLGSVTAQRLGIRDLTHRPKVVIGDRWVEVMGILEPFALAPDLDRAAIIGHQASIDYFDADGAATTVYLRVDEGWIDITRDVMPATADPANPEEVEVSRPSDLLEAQEAAENQFANLFLGLGAVALFVGGIGIANVMVIGVLERRGEIGLRRAIGATRGHILGQFLTESLLLSAAGGAAGSSARCCGHCGVFGDSGMAGDNSRHSGLGWSRRGIRDRCFGGDLSGDPGFPPVAHRGACATSESDDLLRVVADLAVDIGVLLLALMLDRVLPEPPVRINSGGVDGTNGQRTRAIRPNAAVRGPDLRFRRSCSDHRSLGNAGLAGDPRAGRVGHGPIPARRRHRVAHKLHGPGTHRGQRVDSTGTRQRGPPSGSSGTAQSGGPATVPRSARR